MAAWRPLEGVRVADFFWLIAGPLTSRVLAQFGAEVIKIESHHRMDQIREAGLWPPGADMRSPNSVFNDCNVDKRSITLNLNDARGIELAKEIVRRSDIVTNNFTGERMDRWGLGYDDLRALKPDIIMLTMPVMGRTGPYRHYGANGNGVVAYGGLDTNMGFEGRAPVGMGPLYSDFASPFFAVSALMAAFHHRERTGEGQFIDLAQLQATVSLLGPEVLAYTANGHVAGPTNNRSPDCCPHGAYRCAPSGTAAAEGRDDRWCAIAVRSDAEFRALAGALGRPALADEPRFATHEARKAHEDELDEIVSAWTRKRDAWQVMHVLEAAGVMAAVVEDAEDMVVRDPHLARPAGGHFERYEDAASGATYLTHGYPARVDGARRAVRPPPEMGEANEYVYRHLLGLDEERYAALLADEVIW